MSPNDERVQRLRDRMVTEQIEARGIRRRSVLDAMRKIPREAFLDEHQRWSAYSDHPLPIGDGQTISQPYVVALTLEAAEIDQDSVVLDVGTGSGYAAAVAAYIAKRVVTIERHPALAQRAQAVFLRLGYSNIEVVTGDGTLGWAGGAPYDAIIVAAAGPIIPPPWTSQLSPRGRIVMPVGARGFGQRMLRLELSDDGMFTTTDLGAVTFVPLIGEHGMPR